jgi:hypothetical protein
MKILEVIYGKKKKRKPHKGKNRERLLEDEEDCCWM